MQNQWMRLEYLPSLTKTLGSVPNKKEYQHEVGKYSLKYLHKNSHSPVNIFPTLCTPRFITAIFPLVTVKYCVGFHHCDNFPEKNLSGQRIFLATCFRGVSVWPLESDVSGSGMVE